MGIRQLWLRFSRLILTGLIIVIAGCATVSTHPSKVWSLPDEVRTTLSVGDKRDKVRTLLGIPMIDAKDQRLEVYRFTGRDTHISLMPIPLPHPSEKVTVNILVLYDETDKIYKIDTGARGAVGGYRFIPIYGSWPEPDTLLGPPISLEELSQQKVQEGKCSLFLFMNECPMEIVTLDNKQIVDLSPAGTQCGQLESEYFTESEYFRTFIKKDIRPGKHRLLVTQKTHVQHTEFKSDFECEDGKSIYAELDVDVDYEDVYVFGVKWDRKKIINGELLVSNNPPQKNITSKSELSQILWHKGEWYGE